MSLRNALPIQKGILTIASKKASGMSYSAITDAQVSPSTTTTQALQSSVVSGAGVDPAGGATRYPATKGMATEATRTSENCMLLVVFGV